MLSVIQSALFVLAGAAVLTAQPPSNGPALGGIVVGIVLDANTRVRPILGVPGASSLGPPVPIDPGIQIVALAPYQDYVLGLQGDSQQLVLLRKPLGSVTSSIIDGVAGSVSATLSPRGSSALLTDGTTLAQVLSGLPTAPAVAWKPDLSALPSPPSSLAVSDDGTAVAVASLDGDHVSIFLITADSGPRVVASAGQLGGLAFIPGTTDILFGDAQANQVKLLHDSLAVVADSVNPLDVSSSDDGGKFFVASANPAGVIAIDRASGVQEVISCDCNPIALTRLGRSGAFRLTDSTAGMFWLFDSGSTVRRIVAVPPDAPVVGGGAQ